MFADTHASFEVEGLASFSAMKFQSLVAYSTTNARKTGQSFTSGNCERVRKALGSTCETSRHSFKTDSANLSFFHTNLLFLHEVWNMMFESGLQNSM